MRSELRLRDLHASYGKKEVLCGISITAEPGKVLAVIGPNGAGKSTLMRVTAGFLALKAGGVWLGDQEVTHLPPHRRVNIGLSCSMQGGRVFPSLTVREHLEMSAARGGGQDARARILALFPNLHSLLERRAGLLSGGERQSLALAVSLARRPRALLLDEPSAGLAPRLVQHTFELLRELSRRWEIGILLIEQDVENALSIADRAVALVAGTVAMQTDQPRSWLLHGEIERLFLARVAGDTYRPNPKEML